MNSRPLSFHGVGANEAHTSRMGQSIKDQLVSRGVVGENETPEAKRAAARATAPIEVEEKQLPPPFEAPARGIIVESSASRMAPAQRCSDCNALLPAGNRGSKRCAECDEHDD